MFISARVYNHASTGNMTDFGDPLGGASSSTSRLRWGAGFSNNTLGIFAGGEGQGKYEWV